MKGLQRKGLRPIAVGLAAVALFALAFGIYCRLLGVRMGFLNAESGVYLELASSTWPECWAYVRHTILHSYNGHFTPVLFSAELIQSRLFGSHEWPWFVRQMLASGALGAALCWLGYQIGEIGGLSRRYAWVLGACAGTFFLCQPMMLELVSWPFMVMQLLTMATATVAACLMLRFIESDRPVHFAAFLMAAYGTLHLVGTGLATSLGAIATGTVLLGLRWTALSLDARLRAGRWLPIALALTALHAWLMMRGIAPNPGAGELLPLPQLAMRFGWLLMDSVYAAIRAMWASNGMQWPDMHYGVVESVYGWGLLLGCVALGGALAARYKATGERQHLAILGLYCLGFSSLAVHVLLLLARVRNVADPQGILGFFIGPRYVIYPAFYLFLMSGAGMIALVAALKRSVIPLAGIAAFIAFAGTVMFGHVALPNMWPWVTVDTAATWQLRVAEARRSLAAGEPVVDDPLAGLDPGFKTTLKQHRRLLERDLGCQGCVHFQGE